GMNKIRNTYTTQTKKAGGNWYSYVTVADTDGNMKPVIDDESDHVISAYSVNKLAVALAVMDKVDRGQLSLDQKITLTPEIIAGGSGMYFLQQGHYGDSLTLANVLNTMLLVSDNTAVRLVGTVLPGPEINDILASKGFTHTRVEPLPDNPHRFYLGDTTPKEMNMLLEGLANKTLVSPQSSDFILNIMQWINGYNDGIRRNMSSLERIKIGSKYGAYVDSRHEVGIMFDDSGAPALIYTFFNDGVGDTGNYGATNPAVEAEAVLGRTMLDSITGKKNEKPKAHVQFRKYSPEDER
ncbi:MAG TPA: serine hydrolase, partial [Candidatus Saccharimonadales bacterium]|nr:serine hydrolase [Candidatus Saccharimonadales bacterium]